MFIAKGLLIKGLAGLASVLGAGGIAVVCCKDKIWPNSAINTKITALGLPDGCKFSGDERNNTKECTLDEAKLKVVKFSNKETGDLTVEGTVTGLKLSIKKLQESDKQQYGNDIKVGDPWFTFKDFTTDITIKKGESDTNQIKLIKGANPEFKINSDGKLEKAWTVTTLGEKVNLKCPADNSGSENKCSVETGATINYKNSNSTQQLTPTAQVTEGITYTEDTQEYNQGFKFTVSNNAVSGSDNTTLPTGYYEIKYEEGESKGWYLIKKGEIAQGEGGAQEANSANTEINNKITGTLKLPDSCKFTDSDTTNPKECDISEEQLKKIEFKDKGEGDLTLDVTPANLKLSIKKLQESDKQQYGNDIKVGDPWFTFKTESITQDIKVKKSDGTAIASLIKGANPEFKINNNKLEKAWTVTTLSEKVGLTCPANGGSDGSENKCTIEANKTVKFSENGSTTKEFTSSTNPISDKITYTEDQQDHNQGFKFTVASDGITGNNSISLAAGNYEIKYDSTNSWYFFKKTPPAA